MSATKSIQGVFILDDDGNEVAVILDGSVYRLQTLGKLINSSDTIIDPATEGTLVTADGRLATIDSTLDAIKDTTGAKLRGADGTTIDSVTDPEDSLERLAVSGKVQVTIPPPPDGGDSQTYAADSPLSVSGTSDTDFTLPDGDVLHIQQIAAGAAGDPNEKGSVCEIFLVEIDGTENLIDRLYVSGFTEFGNYPDTSTTRDGTSILGDTQTGPNDAILRIRRRRIAGASVEIDCVVRGYSI